MCRDAHTAGQSSKSYVSQGAAGYRYIRLPPDGVSTLSTHHGQDAHTACITSGPTRMPSILTQSPAGLLRTASQFANLTVKRLIKTARALLLCFATQFAGRSQSVLLCSRVANDLPSMTSLRACSYSPLSISLQDYRGNRQIHRYRYSPQVEGSRGVKTLVSSQKFGETGLEFHDTPKPSWFAFP